MGEQAEVLRMQLLVPTDVSAQSVRPLALAWILLLSRGREL